MKNINETSYSRIYQHTQDDGTFAIIGSEEAVKDKDGNVVEYRNRKSDLYKYVQDYSRKHPGCGYNEVNGTYTYDNGEVGNENSLIIYNISKADAIAIGKKLGQESILWKDSKFMGYIYMDGRAVDTTFSNKKGKNMSFSNAKEKGYGSKLPKDKNSDYGFTFEGRIMYPSLRGKPTYETFRIRTESTTVNGYKIKYNKNTEQYEVIINGIVDAEFDTEKQAKQWVANKQDKSADDELKSLVGKVKRLSQSQIERYLTWDEQSKCDTDNIFLAKFKSKKDRISARAKIKKAGYTVISETDDDYNDTKVPYWLFIGKSI